MNLSILEWNIHGAATLPWNKSYEIKPWIVDTITSKYNGEYPDIIILTEFIVAKGFDYLQKRLEDMNYNWFISASTGSNGILIAIKNIISNVSFDKILKYENSTINTSDVLYHHTSPDFYEIVIDIDNIPTSIIGIRIKKDIHNSNPGYTQTQFHILDSYLTYLSGKKHNVICVGDFNAYWGNCWNTSKNNTLSACSKTYSLHTPDRNEFSYVLPNGKKVQLDHLITNIQIDTLKIDNHYDWTFLNNTNGYGNIAEDSSQKPVGIPDHAILRCNINF